MNIFTEDNQDLTPALERVVKAVAWRFVRKGIKVGYTFDDYAQEGRALAVEIRDKLEPLEDARVASYFARALRNRLLTNVVRYGKKRIKRPQVEFVGDDVWYVEDPTDYAAETNAKLDRRTMRAFVDKELEYQTQGQRAPEMRRRIVREVLMGWEPSEVAIIFQRGYSCIASHLWTFVQLARKHAIDAGLA